MDQFACHFDRREKSNLLNFCKLFRSWNPFHQVFTVFVFAGKDFCKGEMLRVYSRE